MVSRLRPLMCRSKSSTLASSPAPPTRTRPRPSSAAAPTSSHASSATATSSAFRSDTGGTSTSNASSTASIRSSLASLRDPPVLYPLPEIAAATNNFLSKRLSYSGWRCSLRGRDAVVFQHRYSGGDPAAVPARLARLGKSHHSSLLRLLGASLSGGYIYLAYEFAGGAPLADCLRNPRNPSFTPLGSWASRMQVAADVADGLEYIHHQSSTIHGRIESSSIIVTDPGLRAKICHFGAAELAGGPDAAQEVTPEWGSRWGSAWRESEGAKGYMAPEVIAGGSASRSADVFAFGVVLLELISGKEPLRYRLAGARRDFERVALVETAAAAVAVEEEGEAEERRGRVRRWVDRRLGDSFPVAVAERLIGVALRCVEAEAAARPEMAWVAGKVSKLYLESRAWAERVKPPVNISVTIAPR